MEHAGYPSPLCVTERNSPVFARSGRNQEHAKGRHASAAMRSKITISVATCLCNMHSNQFVADDQRYAILSVSKHTLCN